MANKVYRECTITNKVNYSKESILLQYAVNSIICLMPSCLHCLATSTQLEEHDITIECILER